ncbi:MAG: peroxidase-related enzyme [Bacteroidota bacterium]|nr:peroxidase-related enzyme [Bacteroidota bacterium]
MTEADSAMFDRYRAPWGGVDHILGIHALLPETLEPHMVLYKRLMFARGPLSRRERELIATVVSAANTCEYCLHHHADALDRVTRDRRLARMVRADFTRADLSEREAAILRYADRLTRNPSADHEDTLRTLRQLGFTDEALLHICLVTAYFNFVNRLALGLGVELESYWKMDGFSDHTLDMAHDRKTED